MVGAKPYSSPTSAVRLNATFGEPLSNPTEFRALVGALQYLTWTRPNISFFVCQLCQFMQSPRTPHLVAAKRILRYLKGTMTEGLSFTKGSLVLHCYTNSDWVGCPMDRRSVSGFCVYFGPNLVSWSAKKQATVAQSSTESEYRALVIASAKLIWICSVLRDL